MEKIIWVIGDDRLEMIEAQRRINAAGSMRALCLLSFEAVQKAALGTGGGGAVENQHAFSYYL